MLEREELIEQAHFFRSVVDRLNDSIPIQELFGSVRHEILVTTKLPLAIDFLQNELRFTGTMGPAMRRLGHYFTKYQTFVIDQAEQERGRFDIKIALQILCSDAEYRSKGASPQGVFLFQLETLCRNRLSYDLGLEAMADDPVYDSVWKKWILTVRRQVGIIDLADLIYVRSESYRTRLEKLRQVDNHVREASHDWKPLFGEKEGRIAAATRAKDPLLLFSALQRQLGYPQVPRQKPVDHRLELLPQMARRLERLESRVKFLEDEQKGGFDLAKFYEAESKKRPGKRS